MMDKKELRTNPLDDFDSGPSVLDKASALIAEQVSSAVDHLAEAITNPTTVDIERIENDIEDVERLISEIDKKAGIVKTTAVPSNYSNPFYGECPDFNMSSIQQAIMKRQWEYCKSGWEQNYGQYLHHPHSFDPLQLLLAISLHTVENLSILNFVGVQTIEEEHSLLLHLQPKNAISVKGSDVPTCMEIVKQHIQSEDHHYNAFYTQELIQDLMHAHPSTGTVAQIATMLADEISAEIYNTIKKRLLTTESYKHIHYQDDEALVLQLYRVTQEMARKNQRGVANKLIVSNDVAAALLRSNLLFISNDETKRYDHVAFMGTVGPRGSKNTMEVFCDSKLPAGEMLMLYKGVSETDVGTFFCPRYLVVQSGLIPDPASFQPQIRLMGKYGQANAITEHGEDALSEYVTHISMDGLEYSVADDKMLTELFDTKPIKSAMYDVKGFYSPAMPLGREVK